MILGVALRIGTDDRGIVAAENGVLRIAPQDIVLRRAVSRVAESKRISDVVKNGIVVQLNRVLVEITEGDGNSALLL